MLIFLEFSCFLSVYIAFTDSPQTIMSLEDTDELPFKLNLEECKDELARNGKVKCPVSGCQQDFMSVWGLKYHVKRANHQDPEGKFKCDRCSSLFQSRVGLQQHRIAEHSSSESCSPASIPRYSNWQLGLL